MKANLQLMTRILHAYATEYNEAESLIDTLDYLTGELDNDDADTLYEYTD